MVLVFFSILLTTLLGMAGFAIDIGNWYLHAERFQKSADAAALGGAVFLPSNPSAAVAESDRIVDANGLNDATVNAHQDPTKPSHMYVAVAQDVPSIFGQFLGLNSVHISRHAVGEYNPPIAMGSPSNVMGNEPPGDQWQNPAVAAMQGNYWLTIHGPQVSKIDGARWTPGACDGSPKPEDCDLSKSVPGQNLDYQSDGQKYVVHVPKGVTGTLAIEAYDAAYVFSGLHCDVNMNSAAALDPVRYAVDDSPYCAGDTSSNGGPPMSTSYSMYNPEDAAVSPGAAVSGCPIKTYEGYYNIDIGSEIVGNPAGTVATTFHKWARLCTISLTSMNGGDYTLRVYQGTTGRGENQFSLRAAIFDSLGGLNAGATAKVNVYSEKRVEMLTNNDSGGTMTFFLAKLQPSYAGRSVTTEMYSIGDDIPADVTILPPTTATSGGAPLTSFTGCTRIRPTQTVSVSTTNCTYPKAYYKDKPGEPGFTGRHGSITVPIPQDFQCDDSLPYGCWLRVKMTYAGIHAVQDTTSWNTYANTELIHLVE